MKLTKFLLLGILFGIVMTKSEVISWYRIQEMFRFHSFHMYGVMGSALGVGLVFVQWIKRRGIRTYDGQAIEFKPKAFSIPRYLFGGSLFGIGWALTGACPGPLFTLLGNGFILYSVVILSAVLGTFVYGKLRNRLPH
ncbi:MAG: YeeE/YedE family protein [Flavobacteriia bacterium]|jgi:uncharacterized membrane protein YedE/YeeE|nr:YeeE/YedE family protein [Flavobacteriia bacterium]